MSGTCIKNSRNSRYTLSPPPLTRISILVRLIPAEWRNPILSVTLCNATTKERERGRRIEGSNEEDSRFRARYSSSPRYSFKTFLLAKIFRDGGRRVAKNFLIALQLLPLKQLRTLPFLSHPPLFIILSRVMKEGFSYFRPPPFRSIKIDRDRGG